MVMPAHCQKSPTTFPPFWHKHTRSSGQIEYSENIPDAIRQRKQKQELPLLQQTDTATCANTPTFLWSPKWELNNWTNPSGVSKTSFESRKRETIQTTGQGYTWSLHAKGENNGGTFCRNMNAERSIKISNTTKKGNWTENDEVTLKSGSNKLVSEFVHTGQEPTDFINRQKNKSLFERGQSRWSASFFWTDLRVNWSAKDEQGKTSRGKQTVLETRKRIHGRTSETKPSKRQKNWNAEEESISRRYVENHTLIMSAIKAIKQKKNNKRNHQTTRWI